MEGSKIRVKMTLTCGRPVLTYTTDIVFMAQVPWGSAFIMIRLLLAVVSSWQIVESTQPWTGRYKIVPLVLPEKSHWHNESSCWTPGTLKRLSLHPIGANAIETAVCPGGIVFEGWHGKFGPVDITTDGGVIKTCTPGVFINMKPMKHPDVSTVCVFQLLAHGVTESQEDFNIVTALATFTYLSSSVWRLVRNPVGVTRQNDLAGPGIFNLIWTRLEPDAAWPPKPKLQWLLQTDSLVEDFELPRLPPGMFDGESKVYVSPDPDAFDPYRVAIPSMSPNPIREPESETTADPKLVLRFMKQSLAQLMNGTLSFSKLRTALSREDGARADLPWALNITSFRRLLSEIQDEVLREDMGHLLDDGVFKGIAMALKKSCQRNYYRGTSLQFQLLRDCVQELRLHTSSDHELAMLREQEEDLKDLSFCLDTASEFRIPSAGDSFHVRRLMLLKDLFIQQKTRLICLFLLPAISSLIVQCFWLKQSSSRSKKEAFDDDLVGESQELEQERMQIEEKPEQLQPEVGEEADEFRLFDFSFKGFDSKKYQIPGFTRNYSKILLNPISFSSGYSRMGSVVCLISSPFSPSQCNWK